jgi:hypothetical protein
MSTEKQIQSQILLALGSRPDVRLFRNHVGGVRGEDGRWHDFGLAKGSADLIGWQSIEVTPEMVGRRLAVLVSIEVKGPGGRVRPEQKNWAEQVARVGGVAVIARSVEEAKAALL